MNADAAEKSTEFCVSVVVGADIIPRTSIKAVHNLRNKVGILTEREGSVRLAPSFRSLVSKKVKINEEVNRTEPSPSGANVIKFLRP